MKSVLIYSKSNIRKNRGNFLMLLLLICIAIALLISSASSLLGYRAALSEKDKEVYDVQNLYLVPISEYRDEMHDYWANDARTEIVETDQAIFMNEAEVSGTLIKPKIILENIDTERAIAPFILEEEDQSVDLSNAIYLPIDMKTTFRIQLGDEYNITYKGRTYEYKVAGFYDLMHLARIGNGIIRVFLSDEAMSALGRDIGKSIVTAVRLHDIADGEQMSTEFLKYLKSVKIFAFENHDSVAINSQEILQPIEFPISMISIISIVLALAIVIVCVAVIGFRIANNIEESVQETGILRASGFTGRQLQLATITEYFFLAVVSGLAGMIAAVPIQAAFKSIFHNASGISIDLPVGAQIAVISVVLIIAIITLASALFSRKVKKLSPVAAFKGGISENGEKGNQIPLGKGFGSLQWRMGVKGLFAYKKPYIVSASVLCIITIILSICASFYSNLILDSELLEKMAGFEHGDIAITVAPYSNAYDMAREIEEIDGVRKTSMVDIVKFEVEELEVTGYLSDDFSIYEVFPPQSGSFPALKNEIAITSHLGEVFNKKIGDTISVKVRGMSIDFLVTGFFTSANAGSRFAMMSEEGYRQIVPEYQRKNINVYLDEGYYAEDMIDIISTKHGVLNSYENPTGTDYPKTRVTAEEKIANFMAFYGVSSANYAVMYNGEIILSGGTSKYQISNITITKGMVGSSAETTGASIVPLLAMFSVIAVVATIIIIRVLINTLTNKRKEELTILRAVGFTSKQLALQLANSFLPAVLLGTVMGCVIGSLTMNPLIFGPMFSSMGISDIYFTVSPVVLSAISFILTAVAYLASLSSVYKIKKSSIVKALQTTAVFAVVCTMMLSFAQPNAFAATVDLESVKEQDDVYPIASISKIYTTAAVMKLVEEEMITLDTPIVYYFPEFNMNDSRYTEITARMLLNHSAGLMGSSGTNTVLFGDKTRHEQVKQSFMDALSQQTLRYTPGERSIYCNDGFTLAEYLVEKVSGMSFTEFLQKNFFEPMQLENTGTVENDFAGLEIMPTYVAGLQTQMEVVYMVGSGGIYASAEDVCRFSRIFTNDYNDGLLSKESLDEMARLQHPGKMVPDNAETNINYGLGWDAVDCYPFTQLGIKALSKNGRLFSASSNLTVLPDYNISVAVIASSGKGDSKEAVISGEIALTLLEELGLIERKSADIPRLTEGVVITEDMEPYTGFYDFGAGFLAEIVFTENSLLLTTFSNDNTRTNEYVHIGNGEFASDESGAELLGQSTSTGGVSGVVSLSFLEDMNGMVYIIGRSYFDIIGIGTLASNMPIGQRIEANKISGEITARWMERTKNDYLLTSAICSSETYIISPIVRFHMYDQLNGYMGPGNESGNRSASPNLVIVDANQAVSTQIVPTVNGSNASSVSFAAGEDALVMNGNRYTSTNQLAAFSEIDSTVTVSSEAMWFRIDSDSAAYFWNIQNEESTSFFIYDEDFNCVNHSLVAEPQSEVLLPENGYIVFVSDGTVQNFTISRVY